LRASPLRTPALPAIGAATLAALLAAGCGGGSRQDAGEKSASYDVKIVHASFPTSQAVAKPVRLEVRVQNTGSHAVPNLAVSVDSFNYTSNAPELAARARPVWAVERGPGPVANPPVNTQEVSQGGAGQTAYVNTWALGPLGAGKTQTFVWNVVPVKPGEHTVHYSIAAGLAGKSKLASSSSETTGGKFTVQIASAPSKRHVDPNTGKVVAGAGPPSDSP
jgi:hypothetical protein